MTGQNRFLILAVASAILLISLAGGCVLSPSSQLPPVAPEPAPAPEITNPSPDTPATPSPTTNQTSLPEPTSVGSDPVSGQSQEVDMRWEQLCLADEYQVQIAKDPDFRLIVVDTGPYAPASSTSPGAYYPAGGMASSPSSLTGWSNLEAGHTYYWRARVRQAATGQHILSPWSEVQSFTIIPGTRTTTASYGIQPIYPNNGLYACPVKPASFSWSPLNDTVKYRFVLAKDAAMTKVLADTVVTTTAYEYQDRLDYGQAYYWRIMALEPIPSDWSAVFTFRTNLPPRSLPEGPATQIPLWAWVVIVIGLILLCIIIVLIFRMRRK